MEDRELKSDEALVVSPKQRLLSNIFAGGYFLALGIFLLLCAFKVIPLDALKIMLPAILIALGLIFISVGIIQRNPVSFWISFAFFVPASVCLLSDYTAYGYGNYYPLYIAIPAIASFFTMFLTGKFIFHLKVVLLFGVISGVFFLNSFHSVGWAIAVPLLIVVFGLCVIYISVKRARLNHTK